MRFAPSPSGDLHVGNIRTALWHPRGDLLFGTDRGVFRMPASGGEAVLVVKADSATAQEFREGPHFRESFTQIRSERSFLRRGRIPRDNFDLARRASQMPRRCADCILSGRRRQFGAYTDGWFTLRQ